MKQASLITTIVLLSATILFTGCASTEQPPTGLAKHVQMPPLPDELSRKATRLPDIKDPTFGGIIKDGMDADQAYNAIAHQLNTVIDLYTCVRKAMNDEQPDAQTSCINSDKK